jgi:hypothetical protein
VTEASVLNFSNRNELSIQQQEKWREPWRSYTGAADVALPLQQSDPVRQEIKTLTLARQALRALYLLIYGTGILYLLSGHNSTRAPSGGGMFRRTTIVSPSLRAIVVTQNEWVRIHVGGGNSNLPSGDLRLRAVKHAHVRAVCLNQRFLQRVHITKPIYKQTFHAVAGMRP